MHDDLQIQFRALVVDDEQAIRRLLMAALAKEGFHCDAAEDGDAAATLIESTRYDLVVVDLAMPHKHGHSLTVDLLAKPQRPVVVVLTGLLEPRLAKDLMARGVDDIVFKPVEFRPLAAKLRSMVDRCADSKGNLPAVPRSRLVPTSPKNLGKLPKVTAEEVDEKLCELSSVPPVSRTGIEVFQLTSSPDSSVQQVAAAVEREPALVMDVLRFANSAFFNPSAKHIADVETAVVRLGQKRVGELAVATATAATLAQATIPFMPLGPVWRKCLAAGICMEMLLEQSHFRGPHDGLFVSAVLQPMCRVIVASMFPQHYETMLKQSQYADKSLTELEQQLFPDSAGAIAAGALALWGIPEEIYRPVQYATLPFHALNHLPEALRHKVEFIKTATFVGEVAAERFETWDLIDVPPASILARLGIQSVTELVAQCRGDLEIIANWNAEQAGRSSDRDSQTTRLPVHSLAYKKLSSAPVDFLPTIVACGNIRLVSIADCISEVESRVIINCLDTPLHLLIAQLRNARSREAVLLVSADHVDKLQQYGRTVSVPCSYGTLLGACLPKPTATVTVPSPALREDELSPQVAS